MAEDPSSNKKKRLVKNPETFRERAQKASEAGDKPTSTRRLKTATGQVANPVLGPIGRFFSKLYNSKPMRPITKVLRFIGKIIFPNYFRESARELKYVTWPNWQESRRLTFAVLVFAVIFGAVIAGVDWVLDKIFRNLLIK